MAYPKLTDKPGALETAAAIRSGQMSVTEAVDAAITRIEQLDAEIDALAVPDFERAAQTAKAMDAALASGGPKGDQPLFGVPMTVKESFDVAGLQSCWGHTEHTDYIAPKDSELVARMKAAGAVIVGKTNVPVDLTDWQSFNPVYGRTNNPHNKERSPGGSSGGSAAAVASGMVPAEFGTDIGGSVRVPAHFCGVWAHKPTWGLISKRGHVHPAMAKQEGFIAAHDGALSVAGPFARNAEDLAVMIEIAGQYPLSRRAKPLKECRILALSEYPGAPVDASVAQPTEAAIDALTKAGVTVERKSNLLPDLKKQFDDYMLMLNIAMARGAPSPNGRRANATDWFDLLDAQAVNQAQWAALFETYDFVLAPPAPVLAIPHSEKRAFDQNLSINGEQVPGASGLVWSGLATLPNLPSTVLPIGSGTYQGAQLPCGMQVIGPLMSDFDCIHTARAIGQVLHG